MDRDVSLGTPEVSASALTSLKTEARVPPGPILDQIGAALDISTKAFARPHCDRTRVLAENAEALRIFAGITDMDARQRGLAYLQWIAAQSSLR